MSYEDRKEFSRKLHEVLPTDETVPARTARPNKIRTCISWRAARSELLGGNLFHDPAWDILLCLYARHLEGLETELQGLIRAIDLPTTVLIRWLTVLEARGLISWNRSGTATGEFIRLTDTGLGGMHALCDVLTKQPLG